MTPAFNPLLPQCLVSGRTLTDLPQDLKVFSSLLLSPVPSPAGPCCFLGDREGLAQIFLALTSQEMFL